METIQSSIGAMKDISLPAPKKVWLKPEVEIIDQDIIESGQAGFLSEAGNLGILPAADYNS